MKNALPALGLMVVSALMLSGCGTVANFATMKPTVYGGIQQDVEFVQSGKSLGIQSAGPSNGSPLYILGLLALFPAEFCCTAVADTLTLPITMVLDDEWHLRKEKPIPEHAEDPIAVGVNGPFLWKEAGEGLKSP